MNHNSKNISIFAAANAIGAWCSWLAFLHGVQAVARSSRAAPTVKKDICSMSFFCFSGKGATPQRPPSVGTYEALVWGASGRGLLFSRSF